MNSKYFVVAVRNTKDHSLKSVQITPSVEDFVLELRAFLHKNKDTAFSLFPADWELVYKEIDLSVVDSVNSLENFVVKEVK